MHSPHRRQQKLCKRIDWNHPERGTTKEERNIRGGGSHSSSLESESSLSFGSSTLEGKAVGRSDDGTGMGGAEKETNATRGEAHLNISARVCQ